MSIWEESKLKQIKAALILDKIHSFYEGNQF